MTTVIILTTARANYWNRPQTADYLLRNIDLRQLENLSFPSPAIGLYKGERGETPFKFMKIIEPPSPDDTNLYFNTQPITGETVPSNDFHNDYFAIVTGPLSVIKLDAEIVHNHLRKLGVVPPPEWCALLE